MKSAYALFTFFILSIASVFGQVVLNVDDLELESSIANEFQLYTFSEDTLSCSEFLSMIDRFEGESIETRLANLDFTTATYFIPFTLINEETEDKLFFLETARPITNGVELYNSFQQTTELSGDGISFGEKAIPSNESLLPIHLEANSKTTFILKLTSDGESLSVPMIFRTENQHDRMVYNKQLAFGVFFGIFVFVIIIYFTFYVMLKDRLFLFYALYVLFSGLLQFVLDGYLYQYIFPSGGYWTQHSVIIIAGVAVSFALLYASRYLEFEKTYRRITQVLQLGIWCTIIMSLFDGSTYVLAFPLVNALSFVTMFYLLVAGILKRRKGQVSMLFVLGLASLVLGGIVFILGNAGIINAPSITQYALKLGTLLEIIFLSILMAGKYKTLQEEKEEAQKRLVAELEEANVRLEKEVEERTKEIEKQRTLLKERNEEFISSVTYAERIQSAVLSNEDKFKAILPESFVIFKPKDIVSGDFYWIEKIEKTSQWPNGLIAYVTADCTGHGVPGAFVSIIANHLLKIGKNHPEVQNPGQMLDFLNREVNETLNTKYGTEQIRDGMDLTLCAIEPVTKQMFFAGAKNSAYIIRNKELIELKGNRKAIGFANDGEEYHYDTQQFQLQSGDVIYTCSDGFADQFGGPNQKKFMSKRLKQMLLDGCDLEMNKQKKILDNAFEEWKGESEQLDDVLLIGVHIS